MLRLVLVSCFFFSVSIVLFSQTSWVVSGAIRGDQGEPLVGASVYVDGAFMTATDVSGDYVFRSPSMPQSITIRYLGYFPQKSTLTAADFQPFKARLDFKLVNQEPQLGEVTITAKPIETIVEEDFSTDLYDFGFVGQHLLLLLREKKRFLVRLIREDGEILSQVRLPDECNVLHKSCIGNFHVCGPQFAWEIAIKDTQIDTLNRYPADNFHKFVEPCAQQQAGQFYFLKHGLLNQWVQYVVFEDNHEPRVAFTIEDEKGKAVAEQALQDFFDGKPYIFRTPERANGGSGGDELHLTWGKTGELSTVEGLTALAGYGRDQIYRIAELETIRRDSVYAPMFKLSDTLCLFDHTNGRIIRFGPQLERTDIVMMDYQWEKGWAKLLLHDARTNRMYARYGSRNGLILKEIDANTGKSGKTYQLALAPYVSDKFKIRNGMLYFLGQPDVNTPNKMLYKMNIFAGQPR
jgi:CarboxypepD_reg-like domain